MIYVASVSVAKAGGGGEGVRFSLFERAEIGTRAERNGGRGEGSRERYLAFIFSYRSRENRK